MFASDWLFSFESKHGAIFLSYSKSGFDSLQIWFLRLLYQTWVCSEKCQVLCSMWVTGLRLDWNSVPHLSILYLHNNVTIIGRLVIKNHTVHESLSKWVLGEDLVVKSKDTTGKDNHQYNTNAAGIFSLRKCSALHSTNANKLLSS